MSVAAFAPLTAAAFHLLALLDRYEKDARAVVSHWPDLEVYQQFSERIDRIQACSASLPGISVSAVGLLIAHSELVFELWRSRVSAESTGVTRALAEHDEGIDQVRRACSRQISRHSR